MTNRQGVSTRLERQNKRNRKAVDSSENDMAIQIPQYKEKGRIPLFFTLVAGFCAGLLAFYLLAVPAIRQGNLQGSESADCEIQ